MMAEPWMIWCGLRIGLLILLLAFIAIVQDE